MKEIGGYFELECRNAPHYHPEGILLNSGRNALRHILRAFRVKRVYVPYYTCPVVLDAIRAEECSIEFYHIDASFLPAENLPADAFVIYNNYFGVCGKNVRKMAARYPKLLVDQAQSFYAAPAGLASFYSPRKFFGLPDGGIVCSKENLTADYPIDFSYDRCLHLLKRHDCGAEAGYQDFRESSENLAKAQVCRMSKLTEAMMQNINFDEARTRRLENFNILASHLGFPYQNVMDIDDVPMVFPYHSPDLSLRKKLIHNRVFVATYWPGIEKICPDGAFEISLQNELLPLPVDQRYTVTDMKKIVDIITC